MAIKKRSYVTVQVYRGVTFEVYRDGRGCWHYQFPDHSNYENGSAESASNARIYARAEIEFKQDRAELQRRDVQPIVPEGYEPAHDTTACKGGADCPYRCPPRVYLVCVDSYSLEVNQIGEFRGIVARYRHRTAQAAFRRLGSLIGGKLRDRVRDGKRFYVKMPDGRELYWAELRVELGLVPLL